MELDLVARWSLYFFGSCFVGLLVGFVIARLSTFELGIGVGMLIPGLVSLSFAWAFLREYRDLSFNPRRVVGTVVATDDRAANESGSVTTPVAIVEYETTDGVKRRAASRGASSLKVDDTVVVVPRIGTPDGVAMGTPHEMQGGAIVSMLFGTFPLSAAIFFLASALAPAVPVAQESRRAEAQGRAYLTTAANLTMVCGILATPFFSHPVAHGIMLGFGVVSVGLWLHVVQAIRARRDVRWALNVAVIAVNFSAWVVALWFLTDPSAGWLNAQP